MRIVFTSSLSFRNWKRIGFYSLNSISPHVVRFLLICLLFCFSSILSTCNKTRECRDQTYQISCHPLVFGRKETGKRLRRCLIAIQSSMFIECICTTISSRRLCGCRPSRARKTAVFHWPAKSSIVTNDYCLEMCRTMCVLYSFFAHILYTNGPSFTDTYTTAMTTSRWPFHCHTIKIWALWEKIRLFVFFYGVSAYRPLYRCR